MPTQFAHLDSVDRQIAGRHLLLHPFYQLWTKGELNREALADYAKQYYRHVAAFPTYLSALHAHTLDVATRRQILANLVDEEGGEVTHPELWLRFADGLGVRREDVEAAEPWDETEDLIATFRRICGGGDTVEGLAALYAYESQIPAVAESKIDGLKRFYGVEDERTLSYFEVHKEADREHSAVERTLLAKSLNETNAAGAQQSVDDVLNALWELLSAVCRRHSLS